MATVEQLPSGSIGRQKLGRKQLADSQISVLPVDDTQPFQGTGPFPPPAMSGQYPFVGHQATERYGSVQAALRSPLPGIRPVIPLPTFHQTVIAWASAADPVPVWSTHLSGINEAIVLLLCDRVLIGPAGTLTAHLEGNNGGIGVDCRFWCVGQPFYTSAAATSIGPGAFSFDFVLPSDQLGWYNSLGDVLLWNTIYYPKIWYFSLDSLPFDIHSFSLQLS